MQSTPERDVDTEDVLGMIEGMALGPLGRGAESGTIEGSPMIFHPRKKIDQKLTPAQFSKDCTKHALFHIPLTKEESLRKVLVNSSLIIYINEFDWN